ncbi:hypothetical protein BpHYR1_034480 [Brachionus plicatilis]|uniref:Uncharacterized protein n=1 Tax=Brachionus plicatilis TaxID=10195 RepID=A0A3M7QFL9_BRAPC|nr:hypothetical protein BpHYR1_034480 [Brachionus plicatilis]
MLNPDRRYYKNINFITFIEIFMFYSLFASFIANLYKYYSKCVFSFISRGNNFILKTKGFFLDHFGIHSTALWFRPHSNLPIFHPYSKQHLSPDRNDHLFPLTFQKLIFLSQKPPPVASKLFCQGHQERALNPEQCLFKVAYTSAFLKPQLISRISTVPWELPAARNLPLGFHFRLQIVSALEYSAILVFVL